MDNTLTELSLPITSLAAVINGIILLVLTYRVILLRRRDGVVLGDNGDRVLTKAIRGQANAAEQIPIAIVILALAELQGGHSAVLITLAFALTIGRASHAIYFGVHGTHWRLRVYGMLLTLIAQTGLILTVLAVGIT
jgi:uncharacterized membrane protein YecN with MAPEG domain